MRSLQPVRPPMPPQAKARYESSAQENPAERSAYQPSVSISMWDWLQASGLDSMIMDVLMWRAWYPNMSWRSPVSVELRVIVTIPPLRAGVSSPPAISRPMPLVFGVAGQEASPPPIGIIMHRLPLMVIMRFWSHCVMVTALPRPPKSISRRSRAPLMYTVLSEVRPITVVRVLIFRSANAAGEKHARTAARAQEF